MKSTTYLLVGALVAIAIIAILKKHFFEVADYDLPTQGNALRFAIEGYEDAEASENAEAENAEASEDPDAEEVEGFEGEDSDDEDADEDVEHMTTAAKAKRNTKKTKAKLRAAAKKLKAKKAKAPAAATVAAAVTAPEKFENTSRFQDLKAQWDAYKAGTGPALSDEDRTELLSLLDAPDESAEHEDEDLEQFEQTPYQGTEYAMF